MCVCVCVCVCVCACVRVCVRMCVYIYIDRWIDRDRDRYIDMNIYNIGLRVNLFRHRSASSLRFSLRLQIGLYTILLLPTLYGV